MSAAEDIAFIIERLRRPGIFAESMIRDRIRGAARVDAETAAQLTRDYFAAYENTPAEAVEAVGAFIGVLMSGQRVDLGRDELARWHRLLRALASPTSRVDFLL